MRILAIDPATELIGWAVYDTESEVLQAYDEFKARGDSRTERLGRLGLEIRRLVKLWRPDLLAIESGFTGRGPKNNPRTSLALAESRGACIAAAGMTSVARIEMVTPAEAKRSATGKGNADKPAVSHAVGVRFGLSPKPPYNAADAIAVALAQSGKEHARWIARMAKRR